MDRDIYVPDLIAASDCMLGTLFITPLEALVSCPFGSSCVVLFSFRTVFLATGSGSETN